MQLGAKVGEIARRFDHWMTEYDHRNDTVSESFKSFIVADRSIVEYGLSYDEYMQLQDVLKGMGYAIEWVVPTDTFEFLVEESRTRILRR